MSRLFAIFVAVASLFVGVTSAYASPRGGGCNMHGCWTNGGGCNMHGCWHSPYGSCNMHGCTNNGECSMHGCPPPGNPRYARRDRGRPQIIVVQPPAPEPAPAPAPPPITRRRYNRDGFRFEYPSDMSMEIEGDVIALNGPNSLSIHLAKFPKPISPDQLMAQLAANLERDFTARGVNYYPTVHTNARFAGVSREGRRLSYDNRNGTERQDLFIWRARDGRTITLIVQYPLEQETEARQYLQQIADSID